ncbi:hypothetical protein KP509_24G055300 [Ceratopteris richardii]|uniref:Histone H2A n=1 Tax=Ceratopteris richardii TaxID=49495 RepID=A0A8T2RXL5_CERRI|nr:hypothetical protein KP509_24G055300 [Ceratopteris richardii]
MKLALDKRVEHGTLNTTPPCDDPFCLIPVQVACPNFVNSRHHTVAMADSRGKAVGKKTTSRSSKADLQFPVGRIAWFLKSSTYVERIGAGAPVYLTDVLECLAADDSILSRLPPDHASGITRGKDNPQLLTSSTREGGRGSLSPARDLLSPSYQCLFMFLF